MRRLSRRVNLGYEQWGNLRFYRRFYNGPHYSSDQVFAYYLRGVQNPKGDAVTRAWSIFFAVINTKAYLCRGDADIKD